MSSWRALGCVNRLNTDGLRSELWHRRNCLSGLIVTLSQKCQQFKLYSHNPAYAGLRKLIICNQRTTSFGSDILSRINTLALTKFGGHKWTACDKSFTTKTAIMCQFHFIHRVTWPVVADYLHGACRHVWIRFNHCKSELFHFFVLKVQRCISKMETNIIKNTSGKIVTRYGVSSTKMSSPHQNNNNNNNSSSNNNNNNNNNNNKTKTMKLCTQTFSMHAHFIPLKANNW